jgi:hypothetical protein
VQLQMKPVHERRYIQQNLNPAQSPSRIQQLGVGNQQILAELKESIWRNYLARHAERVSPLSATTNQYQGAISILGVLAFDPPPHQLRIRPPHHSLIWVQLKVRLKAIDDLGLDRIRRLLSIGSGKGHQDQRRANQSPHYRSQGKNSHCSGHRIRCWRS